MEIEPGNKASLMPLSAAVHSGLIVKDANGYPDAAPTAQQQVQQQATPQAAQQVQQPAAPRADYEHIRVDEKTTGLGRAWQHAASAVVAGAHVNVAELALLSGQTEEYVREVLPQAHKALHTKAQMAAATVGLPKADYAAYLAWAEKQPEGKTAAVELALTGDTTRIRELASRYLRDIPPSQAALKAGGLETWAHNGTEFVNVPGYGPISVAAASKLGLL